MKIENEYKPNTNQIDSQFFAFHLLSQCIHSQICNEKKRAYINTKSYFVYFKTPLYNLSNILFIIFHITLNTIHFLFISLSHCHSHFIAVSLSSLSSPTYQTPQPKKEKTQQPLHPPRIYHHHHNHNHHHHIPIPEFK